MKIIVELKLAYPSEDLPTIEEIEKDLRDGAVMDQLGWRYLYEIESVKEVKEPTPTE